MESVFIHSEKIEKGIEVEEIVEKISPKNRSPKLALRNADNRNYCSII